ATRYSLLATRYSLSSLLHFLHIHPNRAAAGEPDLPRGLVGDAQLERLGFAALDHVECLGHHRALDAAARDAAEKVALAVDDQIGADRPRRRAPGLDHGRQRHPTSLLSPVLRRLQDILVARVHLLPPCRLSHRKMVCRAASS